MNRFFSNLVSSLHSFVGAIGVGLIAFGALIFFGLCAIDLNVALASSWPSFFAGLGVVIIIIHAFARSKESRSIIVDHPHDANGHGGGHGHGGHTPDTEHDEEHHEPEPELNHWAVFMGALVYSLYTIPIMHSWWNYRALAIPTGIVWVAVFALFALAPSKPFPPAAIFWGPLAALGADILRWGLFGLVAVGSVDSGLAGTGLMFAFWLALALIITVVVVFVVVMASKISKGNKILFSIQTSHLLGVKSGESVGHFIAELTGVPTAVEAPPAAVRNRGLEAVWAWMLADRAKRMDIRPFLSNWAWIGPAFAYMGIPYFTTLVRMQLIDVHPGHGHAKSLQECRVMPNLDLKGKESIPAGVSGVEFLLKIGVVLQLVNPFRALSTPDVDHTLEHAYETLCADLARAIGTGIYGFTGPLAMLAERIDGLPETILSPATGNIDGVHGILEILAKFEHHMNAIGYHVREITLKDVDVPESMRSLLLESAHAHLRARIAPAQAAALKAIAGAQIGAFLDNAHIDELDPDQKKAIIVQLAQFYFLRDAGGSAQALGILVGARGADAAAPAAGGNPPAGGNAGGGGRRH